MKDHLLVVHLTKNRSNCSFRNFKCYGAINLGKITFLGKEIKIWNKLAKSHKLNVEILGIDAIPNFYFNLLKT